LESARCDFESHVDRADIKNLGRSSRESTRFGKFARFWALIFGNIARPASTQFRIAVCEKNGARNLAIPGR
jgi:hypothetical protein